MTHKNKLGQQETHWITRNSNLMNTISDYKQVQTITVSKHCDDL